MTLLTNGVPAACAAAAIGSKVDELRSDVSAFATDAMPRVRALAMPHRAAITTSLSAIRLNGRSHFFGRERRASGPTAHSQP